jgi:hypothetical protein
VVGPAAVAQYGLLSDYFGDDVCYNAAEGAGKHANRNKVWDCIPTIGSAIKANNVAASGHPAPTIIEPGVEVSSTTNTSGIAPALAAVAAADVTVLVLGIDKTVRKPPFVRHFYIKCHIIILPRQAPDKHTRKALKKRVAFFAGRTRGRGRGEHVPPRPAGVLCIAGHREGKEDGADLGRR